MKTDSEAITLCKTALDLIGSKPTYMRAVQLLGDIYSEQKRYEDALEAYYQVREHTRSVELDLSIALVYVRLGDLKKAKEFYTEEKFFGDRLGDSYSESQKADYFSQLPGIKDAKSFEASLTYARGYKKDSNADSEGAAQEYRKLVDLFPQNGLFAYKLAEDLMDMKRYDEALPMWARAATFGKGKTALDAKKRLNNRYLPAVREKAMRDVAEIK